MVEVRIGREKYRAEVSAGEHELLADEPEAQGGTDAGPTPYGYLLAALGTCKVITLRMYADRKGWAMQAASVRLSHDRVHAKDCEDCETREGMVDRIACELTLTGDLDEEQRERLREIADKCPVHKTLTSETKIETTLAG